MNDRGFWAEDQGRTVLLKKLWFEGAGPAEIARKIGGGCTPSMVCAKASRLRLTQRRGPAPLRGVGA